MWPSSFSLENYRAVIQSNKIMRFMFNSLVVAGVSSISRVVTGSLAAYSFAFFEYKGKNILFGLVVGTMIIPAETGDFSDRF